MLLTSLNVVKNFVLLGDVQHSVQFVHYRDEVGGTVGNGLMAVLLLLLQAPVAGQAVAEWHACLTTDAMRNLVPAGPPAVAAIQGLQPRRHRHHTVPDQWVRPLSASPATVVAFLLLPCCQRLFHCVFRAALPAWKCALEAAAFRTTFRPFSSSGTVCPCRSSLHLASADSAGTLRLLSYAQNHPESWKGQRLVAW